MILLDTHSWIWWINSDVKFNNKYGKIINNNGKDGICISAISCWEVAKLVEYDRLKLDCSIDLWMEKALQYPQIELVNLTPEVAI